MRIHFLKIGLLACLLFISTRVFGYDFLADPDSLVQQIAIGTVPWSVADYQYNPAEGVATFNAPRSSVQLVFNLKENNPIDLRKTPVLRFKIKANFPLQLQPRIYGANVNPTYNLTPITAARDLFRTSSIPFRKNEWVEYTENLIGRMSLEDPGRYLLSQIRLEITSKRVGDLSDQTVSIKDLEIVPSDPPCSQTTEVQLIAEGATAKTIAEVQGNIRAYRFFECHSNRPTPPQASGQNSLLFFKPPGAMDQIFPEYMPSEEELNIGNHFQITATPGEFRALSFGIRSLDHPLSKVTVSTTGLVHTQTGHLAIGPDDIQIRKIRYLYRIYQHEPREPEPGETDYAGYSLHPNLLVPWGDENLPANFARGGWITIHIPKEAPPGDYTGTLKINIDGTITEVPIQIHVFPFALLEPDKIFSILMYSYEAANYPKQIWDESGQLKEDNLVYQWFVDAREHGLNGVFFYSGIPIQDPEHPNIYHLDVDHFQPEVQPMSDRDWVMQYKRAGFSADIPFLFEPGVWRYDLEIPSEFEKKLPPAIDFIHEMGWKNIIARLYDEATNSWRGGDDGYSTDDLQSTFQVARDAGLETTAEVDPEFMNAIGNGRNGKPLVTYQGGYLSNTPPASIERQKENGGKVFPTLQFQGDRGPILPDRGLKGVWAWRANLDGYYGWNYFAPFGETANEFDGHDYGAISYTEEDGIMPTLMWEMDREAINDYRYIHTLETWIAQVPSNEPWVAEAKAYLNTLKEKFSDNPMFYTATPPTDEDYETMRKSIGDLVTRGMQIPGFLGPDESAPISGGCACIVCGAYRK